MARSLLRRQLLSLAAVAGTSLLASDGAAKRKAYGLDDVSRRIPERGPVVCPELPIVKYRGTHVPYAKLARVYEGFVERLVRFEAIVRRVAEASYGRAPSRLVHMGTFNCRRIKTYPSWLSEHALGNAIDFEGVDFPPLARDASLPEGVPEVFRAPFAVRVSPHWKGRGLTAVHARFLRVLATAVIAEEDLFRVHLGPHFPGHHNHFHLDCAPWSIVDGFEADTV
ncbi:MAG: extensin family protein [Myxococcales bacterium]|nr:extensin family protein [Myxococcales bacterium]